MAACGAALLSGAPAAAAVPGLVGTYFNNATLTAPPALVRVDQTVNFGWFLGSPDSTVNVDNFSARWIGTVRVQTSGNYLFQTVSDDGVRLTVNGTLIIDNWVAHPTATDTAAPVTLTAGVDYPITLEYFENTGNAQVQLLWRKPGDAFYSTIPASNGSLGLSTVLAPALEYRFEEAGWNGTASEVRDTAGSGWNGTAASLSAIKPTTANATPAVGTTVGSCGYGVFNRANKDYVALPATFQNLGASSSFTVTAWIRSSNAALVGQRIFADDENGAFTATVGYGLSLGDAGAGTLRFYTRGTGSPLLDTGAVIASNTWYFIAFSVDLATRTKRIYVYDIAGTALAAVNSTFFEANIGSYNGTASIGGETNSAVGGENVPAYGFAGNIDEVRVYPWALGTTELASVRAIAPPCPAIIARTPGGFNAFEAATAAGSVVGMIHTKVAGSAFGLDVVALDVARSAVLPGFVGTVKVELLDASDNSGALDATTACRASWAPLAGNVAAVPTFVTADAGRKNVVQNEADAWRDVRLRMSWPATGTASIIGCSTDDFAIRPSGFANLAARDADWQTAGSARSLANASASGGAVHKAGRPFTLSASAVNAAATPAVTSRYTGTPGSVLTACAGTGCPAAPGALNLAASTSAGVVSTASASYAEAGSFALQLVDSSWAAVDASDGSTTAERNIVSTVVTVGRFVPDHFDLTPLVTPVLRTFGSASCAARSFTYAGQPFGWATAPQATVLARNAGGATTTLYAGALWKLTAAGVTQAYAPLASATPGLDSSGIGAPALASNGNGSGVLSAAAGDVFKVPRPASVPLNPFNASIDLSWSVADGSEAAVSGNGSIATAAPLNYAAIAFDAGNAFRYGVLKLGSAYGSELVALNAPVEAQYWDGLRLATHTADNCTTLAPAQAALGNYQRNLAACETALGSTPVVLTAGRAYLRFSRPGAGNAGSVDATLNLGATASGQTCIAAGGAATPAVAAGLGWLQGRSAGVTTFDRDPSARISFGQYRSPLVHLRESY